MGNRVYLSLNSGDALHPLFEGNNSLPALWLTLLDNPERTELFQWLDTLDSSDEVGQPLTLPALRALHATSTYQSYFEQVQPELRGLFHDWLAFLQAQVKDGDELGLDLTQYASFFPTTADLKVSLTAFFERLDANQPAFTPDIPGTVGWDASAGQFTEFSASYRAFPEIQALTLQKDGRVQAQVIYPRLRCYTLLSALWLGVCLAAGVAWFSFFITVHQVWLRIGLAFLLGALVFLLFWGLGDIDERRRKYVADVNNQENLK